MKTPIFILPVCVVWCQAEPVPLTNPGGEINGDIDGELISAPSVVGWSSDGGRLFRGGTDFGNGAWRLSFEDSEAIWATTAHLVAPGESFSLRFDAAAFGNNSGGDNFNVDLVLVGSGVRNGDFEADTSTVDSRSFGETPEWFNIGRAGDNSQATRLLPVNTTLDGSRNAVLSQDGARQFAIDTGHTLAEGEIFRASYQWRDASGWTDASDRVGVSLFTTDSDLPNGSVTVVQTLLSDISTADSTYEPEAAVFDPIPASAAGKRLFAFFEGVDGSGDLAGFGRLENFTLQRGTPAMQPTQTGFTAELTVGAARQVVATRTYAFKSTTPGEWHHYHLAVPSGGLDAFASQTLGIQFRSDDSAEGSFQSVDNLRLEFWPDTAPDGAFADGWDNTPDQVWVGPGYWANRLHDWEVRDGRANCTNGARDRRTLHRVGTSLRGNGGDFSFTVRTGLDGGTDGGNARSGFLIGAGPNLDWKGALLVHDGLGRDFGLFAGIRSDGTAVIEDYSTNAVTQIAGGATPGDGFPAEVRLTLQGTYDSATGEYALALEVADPAGAPRSSATVRVPSDRVLGSFGLLSHRGSDSARFWFDDFAGTGAALHPEPDRHLAIVGALHTLSRGTLKLTAHLSPVDLASVPPVALEVFGAGGWSEIATAPIDNTDNLSSYTATFRLPGWDGAVDTDYRVRVDIRGVPYYWQGTVRRDPVEKNEIVVAATTCQRLADGSLQGNGFDWSPVRLWQPHTLAFTHLPKHAPDLFIANGDQIYEGQPTPEDSGTDFNRQHDYLYKWYLWVLQARDITRSIPAIVEPDDHDVFQGNLWGEGGVATNAQNEGGYEEPASWVRLVDRTQTSHLPDADPYNAIQPAPPVAQGIGVYFTGLVYGRVGFAVLEDRKFKTGPSNPPADPDQQFLLGDRQKDFLRAWTTDWAGQDIKCVVSQSPLGNLHTHANSGYGFGLNDRDSHGWPVHRRNEAWALLRQSRMFQIAGDQHLATVAKHGIEEPGDAGYSFTAPAIANFFPRAWDPVHNSAGPTPIVSPYLGDFFFDGNGTLPSGEPNLSANDPAHVRMIAVANPLEYHFETRDVNPANLHDRGAGYGIVRIDKTTRQVKFECWPLHADPEFPNTGSQFDDWPVTIAQSDNDGRAPVGYLPVVDTGRRKNPVVTVYDESDGSVVYSVRSRGSLVRPPVYRAGTTYRVEVTYGDSSEGDALTGQSAAPFGASAINEFRALSPAIRAGSTATLRWDVEAPVSLSIGGGDVMPLTVDGIGYLEVSPSTDTTYTLVLNGGETATAEIRVFPDYAAWQVANFTPAERADPLVSGDAADPDGDGAGNIDEYYYQTDPHDAGVFPRFRSEAIAVDDAVGLEFALPVPLDAATCDLIVEQSTDLSGWVEMPASALRAGELEPGSPTGLFRLAEVVPLTGGGASSHFRARWHIE